LKYKIQLKKPFAGHAILPGLGAGIIPAPETEKLRTKRQNVLTRLEAIIGRTPIWNQRGYYYTMEDLTPEEVVEVNSWEYVRSVREE
jgi:hypothetical protein